MTTALARPLSNINPPATRLGDFLNAVLVRGRLHTIGHSREAEDFQLACSHIGSPFPACSQSPQIERRLHPTTIVSRRTTSEGELLNVLSAPPKNLIQLIRRLWHAGRGLQAAPNVDPPET